MVVVGIDPGLRSGAVAAIDYNRSLVGCYDIPAKEDRIDVRRFHNMLLDLIPPDESAVIVIEDVWVMPKQGIVSSAGFMRAAGSIEAVAMLTRHPVHFAKPQVWKKHHSLIGAPKAADLALARVLWPDAKLGKVKDHGKADALLLAKWGLDVFVNPHPVRNQA